MTAPAAAARREGTGVPTWLSRKTIERIALGLVALTVALTTAFLVHEKRRLVARELQQTEILARVLEDHVNRTLDTADFALGSLADTLVTGQSDDIAHWDAVLTHGLRGMPFLRSLSVIDAAGLVRASSNPANRGITVDLRRVPLPGRGMTSRYGSPIDGRDLVSGATVQAAAPDPVRAAPSKRSFLPLTRAVDEPSDPGRRFLVATINPEFFANAHQLLLGDAADAAALVNYDGKVLTGTEAFRFPTGASLEGHWIFREGLAAREFASAVGDGFDGRPKVMTYRAARARPFVIVTERDMSKIDAAFGAVVVSVAGIVGAVWLMMGSLLSMAWRSLRGHEALSRILEETRESARKKLQSQLDFAARLLDVSPGPIFVTDRLGRYLSVNRAWLQLTGLDSRQVIGRTAAQLFGADNPMDGSAARSATPGDRSVHFETRFRGPDDGVRHLVITETGFGPGGAEEAAIIGSIFDVTDFREAERSIRLARDAARRSDQAKSEFIANMTHELRTPLQSILGFSDLGRDMAADRPDLVETFEDIHAGGRRMLTLVNGLLDLSKMEMSSTPHERVTLAPLVQQVLHEFEPLIAQKDVSFATRLDHDAQVTIDSFRFQQVVRNVVSNAVKFSPPSSTVDIVLDAPLEDIVELTVRDRGPGIPPDETETIFGAFSQSSRTRDGSGGTGLGLTISRKIMQAHRGTILAANCADGIGAVLRVRLPTAGATEMVGEVGHDGRPHAEAPAH